MADPSETDRAKAKELRQAFVVAHGKQTADEFYAYIEDAERNTARALADARKAPPGHIIDDHGVVRRVLGTLPVTADGCVVGNGHQPLWWRTAAGRLASSDETYMIETCCGGIKYAYSTAEAAESAKGQTP